MLHRVFVSYAREDGRFAEELGETLRLHAVRSCWSRPIVEAPGGPEEPDWHALRACAWFLAVLSPRSVRSDLVRAEVAWAMENRGRERTLALLIADCDPGGLHPLLPQFNFIDFRRDPEDAYRELLAALGVPGPAAQAGLDGAASARGEVPFRHEELVAFLAGRGDDDTNERICRELDDPGSSLSRWFGAVRALTIDAFRKEMPAPPHPVQLPAAPAKPGGSYVVGCGDESSGIPAGMKHAAPQQEIAVYEDCSDKQLLSDEELVRQCLNGRIGLDRLARHIKKRHKDGLRAYAERRSWIGRNNPDADDLAEECVEDLIESVRAARGNDEQTSQ